MKIEIQNISDGDYIIVYIPMGTYDVADMQHILEELKQCFPENQIVAIPQDFSLSILHKENQFL